jgi:hypothetical protein
MVDRAEQMVKNLLKNSLKQDDFLKTIAELTAYYEQVSKLQTYLAGYLAINKQPVRSADDLPPELRETYEQIVKDYKTAENLYREQYNDSYFQDTYSLNTEVGVSNLFKVLKGSLGEAIWQKANEVTQDHNSPATYGALGGHDVGHTSVEEILVAQDRTIHVVTEIAKHSVDGHLKDGEPVQIDNKEKELLIALINKLGGSNANVSETGVCYTSPATANVQQKVICL